MSTGMKRSAVFADIRADVVAIVRTLPCGRVTSFSEIAAWLLVGARDVSHALSTLDDAERERVPWHRVVGVQGKLGVSAPDAEGRSQADRLAAEGIVVRNGRVHRFQSTSISLAAIEPGVPPGRGYS